MPGSNIYTYACELNICQQTQYFDTSLVCSKYEKNLIFINYLYLKSFYYKENRKKLNEPCSDIAFECDSNLVCIGTTGSKICS